MDCSVAGLACAESAQFWNKSQSTVMAINCTSQVEVGASVRAYERVFIP